MAATGVNAMSGIYLVGAVLAALLLVYLFLALLKPEWFA
jgi:K+-transporting ATPase KdpF subunit